MHRHRSVILTFVLLGAPGCDQRSESDPRPNPRTTNTASDMHPILKQLASLPYGITVSHSPNPVKAQLGGRSGSKYTWLYTTNVAAQSSQIGIEEFGSFTWHNGKWVFANFTKKPFSANDFSEWYGCPHANLTVGDTYSDDSNWTGGDVLTSGKMRWYFIGRDEMGNRVKGEATIETLAEAE